jgi:electron transfer flavoprotein beta subunit
MELEVRRQWSSSLHAISRVVAELEVTLPAVICATKDLAAARIPNMKGIMSARTKPLTVVAATSTDKLTTIASFTLPDKAKQIKMIQP